MLDGSREGNCGNSIGGSAGKRRTDTSLGSKIRISYSRGMQARGYPNASGGSRNAVQAMMGLGRALGRHPAPNARCPALVGTESSGRAGRGLQATMRGLSQRSKCVHARCGSDQTMRNRNASSWIYYYTGRQLPCLFVIRWPVSCMQRCSSRPAGRFGKSFRAELKYNSPVNDLLSSASGAEQKDRAPARLGHYRR